MPGTQHCSRRTILEPGTHPAFCQGWRVCRSNRRAGVAPEPAGFWRSSGRAGLAIVPATPRRPRVGHRTLACRATLAVHRSGAPLQATKEAAGVPSAWSQFLNPPPRDRADGATLGRRRRTGRLGLRDATHRGIGHRDAFVHRVDPMICSFITREPLGFVIFIDPSSVRIAMMQGSPSDATCFNLRALRLRWNAMNCDVICVHLRYLR